jgi:hypothetical protein
MEVGPTKSDDCDEPSCHQRPIIAVFGTRATCVSGMCGKLVDVIAGI